MINPNLVEIIETRFKELQNYEKKLEEKERKQRHDEKTRGGLLPVSSLLPRVSSVGSDDWPIIKDRPTTVCEALKEVYCK